MVSENYENIPVVKDIVNGWAKLFNVDAREQARDSLGMGVGELFNFGNSIISEGLGIKLINSAEGLILEAAAGRMPGLKDSDRRDLQRLANYMIAKVADPTPQQITDVLNAFTALKDGLFPRFGPPDWRKVASGLGLKDWDTIQKEWAAVRAAAQNLIPTLPLIPVPPAAPAGIPPPYVPPAYQAPPTLAKKVPQFG